MSIVCDEEPSLLQLLDRLLCAAYEKLDSDGRKMLRLPGVAA